LIQQYKGKCMRKAPTLRSTLHVLNEKKVAAQSAEDREERELEGEWRSARAIKIRAGTKK
jgi:hypothetical protein